MSVWQRILRYLILWGILLAILCVLSIIRYWDELMAIAANALSSTFTTILYVGLGIGIIVWGFRLLLRSN